MTFEFLKLSEESGVLTLTIDRPEAMNALSPAVMKSLDQALTWLEAQSHIRAVIVTGGGEKAFVAGADIKQFENMNPAGATEVAERGQALYARFENLKVPVIAAVNGFALGGGLELALACDFIYASENAKFGLPECTLGIMPGYGGTVRLPRRVGLGHARELAITGAMISAQEALSIGLVNRVLPLADLLTKARETALVMASRAPLAVARIKKSINDGASLTMSQASSLEAKLFGELFGTQDKIEGVQAFLAKRKPSFKGS